MNVNTRMFLLLKTDKLPGSASKNLRILNIFPLAVYDVIDTSDLVWKMVLKLQEISGLLMAFKISVGQVAYLRILLLEYIKMRIKLFPNTKLRPKHHYILHYPYLIKNLAHYVICGLYALKVNIDFLKMSLDTVQIIKTSSTAVSSALPKLYVS